MKFTDKIKNLPAVKRYRQDFSFRTVVNALFSSAASALVGAYNLAVAVFAGVNGVWLYTLAAYYFALAFARIALLISNRAGKKRGEDENRSKLRGARNFLGGGALIILLTRTYSGIIVLVTAKGYHYDYRGNMMYVMAAYAFYKIISSIVVVAKHKNSDDFTVRTLRLFNVADGIVSIIALQSAMLYAFSEDGGFAGAMNAAIGGVAGAILLALGTYMIISGFKKIAEIKADKNSPPQ